MRDSTTDLAELAVHGYELPPGTSVVDANALIHQPGFWPAYLGAFAPAESVDAAFAVDGASAVERAMRNQQRWPAISLRLAPAGRGQHWYWLRIVYRNFPGDAGIDFLVTSDLGGSAVTIACVDGHFRGPGVCWAELQALTDMPDEVWRPEQRRLLALPLLGDADVPTEARATIADALRSVGATGDVEELAGNCLDGQSTWQIRQGVRMCLGRHALRHVQDMSLNKLRDVDIALGGRYYRSRSRDHRVGGRADVRMGPRWRYEVTDSRADAAGGVRLRGHLHGEIRDGEPARLTDGATTLHIGAIHLNVVDTATGQLVVAIPDADLTPPAPGALLLPVDACLDNPDPQ